MSSHHLVSILMFAIALLFAIFADAVLYQANGHLYSLAKTDSDAVLLLDYDTGRLSRLKRGGDGYIGGPSIGVETPIAVKVLADDESVTIDRGNEHVVAKRVRSFRTESMDGGTLYIPTSAGESPLLIGVPGSGMALSAPYFARRGIAVLALDKRTDWQSATYDDIASDVVAAANSMRDRFSAVGIYASSQGGWIAPIAATKSSVISFIVCAACPATPMPQQELLRTAAELRADGFAAEDVAQAVAYRKQLFRYLHDGTGLPELERLDAAAKHARWYARFGGVPSREAPLAQWWRINDAFDPVESWRRVRVPALLLFGDSRSRACRRRIMRS